MNVIFVDAENVGQQAIQDIDTRITDKVFVFTNNEQIKSLCHDLMFIAMSGYPVGKNQADFYIIGHLCKALSQVHFDEKKKITFCLHSNDNSLCQAFEFQCQLASIQSTIVNDNPPQMNNSEPHQYTVAELNNVAKIYKVLKQKAMQPSALFKATNIDEKEGAKLLNILFKKELIARSHNNKKIWTVVAELKPELFA
ncbi:putative uncharacterized protein (plasmid) [Aliivibrio wodanis]|uniref:PIN-like domain-containing protein n=1 Tax=Aliivibrio wodanis TaxID=80852 RepID=A0A090K2S2_9GAMM|nr:putative uncharacterized protein [Aliivibrio wodanis]